MMTDRIASMATTRTGLRIGIQTIPRQVLPLSTTEDLLQRALLERRTAAPLPLWRRALGAVWGWL